MAIAPPLNQGWGYGIVLGLGALFAFGMVSSSLLRTTYGNEKEEERKGMKQKKRKKEKEREVMLMPMLISNRFL